jgi:replication-associated recombination protein RarA
MDGTLDACTLADIIQGVGVYEENEMSKANRDPWGKVKTKSGLPADQVISALQKEIRRGRVENACLLAYEMAITSPALENFLWERLKVISVEDIGLGEPQAPAVIQGLFSMWKETNGKAEERLLFSIHAVRYLCSRKKDRSSDEMLTWIRHSYSLGKIRPVIPEYALDMHTAAGRREGRGRRHFFEQASQVSPVLPRRGKTYLKRIMRMLDGGDIPD